MANINTPVPKFRANPAPQHYGLTYNVGRSWEAAKDYWDVLRPMRFCVLVWIGITLLIVSISQSQDALLALLENIHADTWLDARRGIGNLIAFAVLAFFWAIQTFYWARFVSRLPARPRRPVLYEPPILTDTRMEYLNEKIPRRLGALALLSVWAALLRANWWTSSHTLNLFAIMFASAIMIALLIAYRGIVRARRNIANALHQKFGLAAFAVDLYFARDLNQIALGKLVKRISLSLAVATLAAFVASGYKPMPIWLTSGISMAWIGFGLWASGQISGLPPSTVLTLRINIGVFGLLFLSGIPGTPITGTPVIAALGHLSSAPIIMSVAAAWVFIGTFFLAFPGEVLRLPITTFVILFAVISSVMGRYDNHMVRVVQQSASTPGTQLGEAFDRWWKDVPKSTDPVPLVLVATAGGASRAAYWTTKVLAQIEQDHPGFHKYIFAISSVSGGSLGTIVYRTMLNDVVMDNISDPHDWSCPKVMSKATKHNLVHCGLSVIDHDFLAPTFLTGLYPDLTQRFLPGSLLPDRAAALERSWEEAWRSTMPAASVGLDRPFHSLWTEETWLPALIINGTSEKTGRRIITSNLLIEDDRFTDALDYFTKINPYFDIAVSTAAHNSARFPYIDAAGTLETSSEGIDDRIVDGGYFENFGAGSIYDLLRARLVLLTSRETET